MRTASTIARYLAGVIFISFRPERLPELHSAAAPSREALRNQFAGCTAYASHYLPVGDLRLSGRRRRYFCWPSVTFRWRSPCWRRSVVNILAFLFMMAPSDILLALFVATILWAVIFFDVRPAFAGLFQSRLQALFSW